MSNKTPEILGHPAGLFTLFFTEMWERFSYYGMRALLVLFLVSDVANGGWSWTNEGAATLYAFYTGLVYVTPIFGGLLADRWLGYRKAVVVGAVLMTAGHASMAIETPVFFYLGLSLLILGNGAFKPNVSSIVGGLYPDGSDKKDGAYTIFYMGINAGAFLGILLCGYIGEKVGWSYGFGLAGIFMFVGMIQFWFGQGIFGNVGLSPKQKRNLNVEVHEAAAMDAGNESEVAQPAAEASSKVTRDRLVVIGILAFFTIFFWWAFEQAGSSMTIFAKDFTQRNLSGGGAQAFKWVNVVLTVVPLTIVSWVLALLFKKTVKNYAISVIALSVSFLSIWGIALWIIQNDFNSKSYTVEYTDANGTTASQDIITTKDYVVGQDLGVQVSDEIGFYFSDEEKNKENVVEEGYLKNADGDKVGVYREGVITGYSSRQATGMFWKDIEYANVQYEDFDGSMKETTILLSDNLVKEEDFDKLKEEEKKGVHELVVGENYSLLLSQSVSIQEQSSDTSKIVSHNENEVEVAASWFGILNSLFIILFAPVFSKIWESKYNPSASIKFGLGLILLGIGFGVLSFGASAIPQGAEAGAVRVGMIWLVLAYLLHTLGELVLSPVGLSYVSKLAPARLVGMMFGLWFTATAIANFLGGITASFIDKISEEYSLSIFFLIFTAIPIGAGLIMMLLTPMIKKKMHGIH